MPGIYTAEDLEKYKQDADKTIHDLKKLKDHATEYLKWFTNEITSGSDIDDIMNIVDTHWGDTAFLADVQILMQIVANSNEAMPKKANTTVKLAQTVYIGEYLHQYLKYKQEDNK